MARPVPHGHPVGWARHPAAALGFPCCVDLPVHACRRQYPGGVAGCLFRSLPQRQQPSPFQRRVGLHITLFGACSAFTTRCSPHARRVTKVTLSTEGFSRFVTSTAAPIATGWSESCRVGLSPTGKSRLCTAHVESRRGAIAWALWQRFVSSPRSSNRTGQAMASGSRTRRQAFALGKRRTSGCSCTSPSVLRRYSCEKRRAPVLATLCLLHSHRRSRSGV